MNTGSKFKTVVCKICSCELRINRNVTSKNYYCNKCQNEPQPLKCDRCNCDYVGIPPRRANHFCITCTKNNDSDLAGMSSRTFTKIMLNAKLSCAMCGWDECKCDVHHIIPKSEGGLDNLDNLINICPNCHRKAHNNLYSREELLEKSMKNFEIANYYDTKRSKRKNKLQLDSDALSEEEYEYFAKSTGKEISSKYGISESDVWKIKKKIFGFTKIRKFNVPKEQLKELIDNYPMTSIGKMFGVSDNAVRKRAKLFELIV